MIAARYGCLNNLPTKWDHDVNMKNNAGETVS